MPMKINKGQHWNWRQCSNNDQSINQYIIYGK